MRCYRTFILDMPRSPGFGSDPTNYVALFRLAFAAPTPNGLSLLKTKSLTHYTKVRRHPMMIPPKHRLGLRLFVGVRFQGLFHSLVGVLFTFPLTVLVRYRSARSILAFEGGPRSSDRISRVPPYLICPSNFFSHTGLSPISPNFFQMVLLTLIRLGWSSRSLAATDGVSVDFLSSRVLRCFSSRFALLTLYSGQCSGYTLLVSPIIAKTGQRPAVNACRRSNNNKHSGGFPIRTSGIKGCLAPRAYRRVPRPSSPLAAKASTKRPFSRLGSDPEEDGPFACSWLTANPSTGSGRKSGIPGAASQRLGAGPEIRTARERSSRARPTPRSVLRSLERLS